MTKYTANGTPSEDDEEHLLSDYCDVRGWQHSHVSNETYTTSWNQKRKMKYLGVSGGFPDHVVVMDCKPSPHLVFIELKRQKGGTISDKQFEWIHTLIQAGQKATVCYGGQEAIDYLESIEKGSSLQFELEDRFLQKYQKRLAKQQRKDSELPY